MYSWYMYQSSSENVPSSSERKQEMFCQIHWKLPSSKLLSWLDTSLPLLVLPCNFHRLVFMMCFLKEGWNECTFTTYQWCTVSLRYDKLRWTSFKTTFYTWWLTVVSLSPPDPLAASSLSNMPTFARRAGFLSHLDAFSSWALLPPGAPRADWWGGSGSPVSGAMVRKLNIENLSLFTVGRPTMVDLKVQ